ncbi:carboxylate-amine ligase [Motilibacter deserti]|uniref:Putative glutamate--cysteine ligase 2 n=1 Tax=Motilibacter deserti TaxID=2714956 RepID=A0ABX0GTS7_9ACTN|nr:YbdK family carboxylate-amine ligase [Motilibacter deserti]
MTTLAPLPDAVPERPAAAVTVGVEEEYHLVDAETLALRDSAELNDAALHGRMGPQIQAEIATTQLETATAVCRTAGELRQQIVHVRTEAAAAAATAGSALLVASTHPFATWDQQRLTARPRYIELFERWGLLALQQVICGCHVHVSVPDLDTAVAVMDRARAYLPTVLAMTGSSPFHEGTDTGYDSYRTQWFARWPITGPTEPLGSGTAYLELVEGLRRAGVIEDSSSLYWDVRPSAKYPTVEFRVGDVCTEVDDVVLHAVLLRSLTRVLAAQAERGVPAPEIRPELLRAARWRAARHGLSESLFDVLQGDLVPAPVAVERLLALLRHDLQDAGEWQEASELTTRLLARGTSAQRQRAVLQRTGDLRAVAASVVLRAGSA